MSYREEFCGQSPHEFFQPEYTLLELVHLFELLVHESTQRLVQLFVLSFGKVFKGGQRRPQLLGFFDMRVVSANQIVESALDGIDGDRWIIAIRSKQGGQAGHGHGVL